jgi:hypothetical protein
LLGFACQNKSISEMKVEEWKWIITNLILKTKKH